MTVLLVLVAIILLFIVGIAVLGLVLKLLWFVLIGLVIGALARLVIPGQQQIGLLATALYGIGGSLIGGIIAHALDLGGVLSFLVAVGVAAALIALIDGAQRRRLA
jgi:uncharacterized membrane protein YeaQ/YmgE (transglycosylase-associated protein family)